MSIKTDFSHESLFFDGGFIFDKEMNRYMLWKQHEFNRWWRGFETLFTHPLSRTFINSCLLYTSPSPRDRQKSRMPSSA